MNACDQSGKNAKGMTSPLNNPAEAATRTLMPSPDRVHKMEMFKRLVRAALMRTAKIIEMNHAPVAKKIGRQIHLKKDERGDDQGEGAKHPGRGALRDGAAVPEEIQIGRAQEFIDHIARPHHAADVRIGRKREDHQKCLTEPNIGRDFRIGHGLGRCGGSEKRLEDHDADEAPKELRAKPGNRRSAVLQERAEPGRTNRRVRFDNGQIGGIHAVSLRLCGYWFSA